MDILTEFTRCRFVIIFLDDIYYYYFNLHHGHINRVYFLQVGDSLFNVCFIFNFMSIILTQKQSVFVAG